MPLTKLLFTAEGRIPPRLFLRGMIAILIAITLAMLIGMLVPVLAIIVLPVVLGSIFPYACISIKRLHDSGRSGLWFIGIFILFFVVLNTVMAMLNSVLLPEYTQAAQDYLLAQGEAEKAVAQERLETILQENPSGFAGRIGASFLGSIYISNAFIAFILARLRSDPQPNAFGPPRI